MPCSTNAFAMSSFLLMRQLTVHYWCEVHLILEEIYSYRSRTTINASFGSGIAFIVCICDVYL